MIFSKKMFQNRNFSSTEIQKFRFRYNKPYIVSLSGLSLDDNLEMLKRVLEKFKKLSAK